MLNNTVLFMRFQDYTSFIVLARNPTGLLKFGCSFLYEVS